MAHVVRQCQQRGIARLRRDAERAPAPAGEVRDFFSEPEVMNAALFGAAFTDSGYWPLSGGMGEIARAYSEHTHWEPFIHDVVTWIRANDPPPWTSLESKKRAAFFIGCASHGMQDELFDSLFLDEHRVVESLFLNVLQQAFRLRQVLHRSREVRGLAKQLHAAHPPICCL